MIWRLFLFLLLLAPAFAHAGVDQLSEGEFRALAAELAPKVNLFSEAWAKDPAAEFYGGTTRDYLYWIKGQFRDATSAAEARAVADKLRAMPVIDVRSFIIGDSDVDVFSKVPFVLKAEDFGVRKIDVQPVDVLDPATELGSDEVKQGFVPAEKIRLARDGFHENPALGEGVKEIYSGRLTVHFADPADFATTKYARDKLNHPILLALRYLRLAAIDYFRDQGAGLPARNALLARLDPASAARVREVIAAASDGRELTPYLAQRKFVSWLNGGIQKAFRSYTNPDAAKILMDEFGVTHLPDLYPGKIEPVNQYVFQQFRDEGAIEKALRDYGVDRAAFFRSPAEEFPDGYLYHGTKEEKAFRSILFQGVLGSSSGSGGAGLYGVDAHNQKFAEDWAGDRARLLRFPVRSEARIVDIEAPGEGKRIWEKYSLAKKDDFEGFSRTFGFDILRYPYGKQKAFVVKNSGVLGRAEGVYRQLRPFPELLELAAKTHSVEELLGFISVNSLSDREVQQVIDRAPVDPAEVKKLFREKKYRTEILTYFFPRPDWKQERNLLIDMLAEMPVDTVSPEMKALLEKVLGSPTWRHDGGLRIRAFAKAERGDREKLLMLEPWRGDRSLMQDLLQRLETDPSPNNYYLFEALQNPVWIPHADLILPALEREHPRRLAFQIFLSEPWHRAYGDRLRKLALAYAAANPMNASFLLGTSWHRSDRELVETVLSARASHANLALRLDHQPDWAEIRPLIIERLTGAVKPDLIALNHLGSGSQALTESQHEKLTAGMERALASGEWDNLQNAAIAAHVEEAGKRGAPAAAVDEVVLRYVIQDPLKPFVIVPGGALPDTPFFPRTLLRWAADGGKDPRVRQALLRILKLPELRVVEYPFLRDLIENPALHLDVRKAAEDAFHRALSDLKLEYAKRETLTRWLETSARLRAEAPCELRFGAIE